MIAIVDYGRGNVRAILNVYRSLNIEVLAATSTEELGRADRIILPGVGSFDQAITRLNKSGMRRALEELVLSTRTPVLGICVGMQMMAHRSEEGAMEGLGWIDGEVHLLDTSRIRAKPLLPHMGWNRVDVKRESALFSGLASDSLFYFLHSYAFASRSGDVVLAETDYGGKFTSSVNVGNVFGVQFHPEKSHQWGTALLKNFAEI